jgi:deazaflavin-dependent oxidoreductase (nitroreductase family)
VSGRDQIGSRAGAETSRPAKGGRFVARITNALGKARLFSVGGARMHAAVYRRSKGRIARRWFGAEVLVLETVGRKSGKPRATPVIYVRDGQGFAVIAANAGNKTPAWLLNLEHSGHGFALLDGRRIPVSARRATSEERRRLWPELVANYPANARYPEFAGHELPVILLTPDGTDG